MARAIHRRPGPAPEVRALVWGKCRFLLEHMRDPIQEAKRLLRDQVGAVVRGMTVAERGTASAQACALLKAQALWQTAQSVLFFSPLPRELDVWPLLNEALSAGKGVALPRFVADIGTYEARSVRDPGADLHIGQFGIREPTNRCPRLASDRLDLILVPGVAFDLRGGRLGRGRGYYDRLLRRLHGTTCAVAFDQQIVGKVPVAPPDVRLNVILTPTRWVKVEA